MSPPLAYDACQLQISNGGAGPGIVYDRRNAIAAGARYALSITNFLPFSLTGTGPVTRDGCGSYAYADTCVGDKCGQKELKRFGCGRQSCPVCARSIVDDNGQTELSGWVETRASDGADLLWKFKAAFNIEKKNLGYARYKLGYPKHTAYRPGGKTQEKLREKVIARLQREMMRWRDFYHLDDYWKARIAKFCEIAYQDELCKKASRTAKKAGLIAYTFDVHSHEIDDNVKVLLDAYCADKGIKYKSVEFFWRLARNDVLGLGDLELYCCPGEHVHIVGFGDIDGQKVKENYEKTGDVFVNLSGKKGIRSSKHLYNVLKYNYDHAHCIVDQEKTGRGRGDHTIRYGGLLTSRYLAVTVYKKREPKVCPACGERMVRVPLNADGSKAVVCHYDYEESYRVVVTRWIYLKSDRLRKFFEDNLGPPIFSMSSASPKLSRIRDEMATRAGGDHQ